RSRSTVWPPPASAHRSGCPDPTSPRASLLRAPCYGPSASGACRSRGLACGRRSCGGPSHGAVADCRCSPRKPEPPAAHTPFRTEQCGGSALSTHRQSPADKDGNGQIAGCSFWRHASPQPMITFTLCLPTYLSTLELDRRDCDAGCSWLKSVFAVVCKASL